MNFPSLDQGGDFFFAQPAWLWGLLLLLPLLLLRRKAGTSACVVHPALRLIQDQLKRPSTLAGKLGMFIFAAAYTCLLLALAQPQLRHEFTEDKVSGIDIMIAFDLSGSMAATDMNFASKDARGRIIQQRVDRLTAAKHVISQFIENRPNDRMGIVAFAGQAKLSCPLTLDHQMLCHMMEMFYLEDVRRNIPGYIASPGTAIGSAIASAATRLEERKETKSKIIILVTDGHSNRGSIAPIEAAEQAAKLGIRIFTIAIGQKQQLSAHVQDAGADEKSLREIARITNGHYFRASSGQELMKAFQGIDRLEKTEAKRRTIIKNEPLFPYPLAAACVLLLLSFTLNFMRPQAAP
ncbi:MAG: VWA domain-containing protein [Akkermansia sp.]